MQEHLEYPAKILGELLVHRVARERQDTLDPEDLPAILAQLGHQEQLDHLDQEPPTHIAWW